MIIFLLVLAILCASIACGLAVSRDLEAGARASGTALCVGLTVLLVWVAIR